MITNQRKQERAEKEVFWQNHTDAWKISKMSATKYCQQNNLKLHQLKYWDSVLNKTSKSKKSAKFTPEISFVEVTSTQQISSEIGLEKLSSHRCTIKTPCGHLISFEDMINITMLKSLLLTIKESSCSTFLRD